MPNNPFGDVGPRDFAWAAAAEIGRQQGRSAKLAGVGDQAAAQRGAARGNFRSANGNEDLVAFRSQLTSTRLQRDSVRGGYPPLCTARVNIDMMHSLAVPPCPGSAEHRATLLFPF